MTFAPLVFWLFYAWCVLQHVKENISWPRGAEIAQGVVLLLLLLAGLGVFR